MSFAEMFIKARSAAQGARAAANISKNLSKAVGAESSVATGALESLSDDVIRAFGAPKPEGFVRQATTTVNNVRHAGDTFASAPRTTGLTFSPRTGSARPVQEQPVHKVTSAIDDAIDDVLPTGNSPLNEIDDFWNERMSQSTNEYLDNVYKTIDDSLGFGW